MRSPSLAPDEAGRIEALHALGILDTEPEERFDRLTRLARRLFDVPIAIVSLVDTDRQWFKSCLGLAVSETPREISFCGHAILEDDIFLIPDATQDVRFHDNPLVVGAPHIRFYAGCPLSLANGSRLGTLCIIDRSPRQFNAEDKALLRDLARMAEQELFALQLATTDELTALSNRRGFHALTSLALGLCRRHERSAWLLSFDLDGFKEINDRLGHAEGDRALISFASLLKRTFRESDVLGRLGGDEFAVLVTDADSEGVTAAVDRLREATDQHNRNAFSRCDIRYSVGVVLFDPSRHAGVADLAAESDTAMFQNKSMRRRSPPSRPGRHEAIQAGIRTQP